VTQKVSSSFRDPSGVVFTREGKLFRQVNKSYQSDYDLLMASGLYQRLVKEKKLIAHEEVSEAPLEPALCYQVIAPERIEFISYPYEWSFSQLKDAALLTLTIEKEALELGMVLKDASAYNIQFQHGRPVLIDTLSFTRYVEGEPWVAYRQFCQHFLAPLALMAKVDLRMNKELLNYIDGIPLDLCSAMLPRSTRLNLGFSMHIHMHARAQANIDDEKAAQSKRPQQKVSKYGLMGLIDSLTSLISGLHCQILGKTWADYYSETNYSDSAFEQKKKIIADVAHEINPKVVYDLGANTGIFSREVAKAANALVISSDIDPEAVELNYQQLKQENELNILPLVVDLTNPSPAIGWENTEREAFLKRGKADLVLALALIHHLAIANNVPLERVAECFQPLGRFLLLEFVPKEDSQVKRLLSTREDIFSQYTVEGLKQAFSPYYRVEKEIPVEGSKRIMFLFEAK
jgi:SAM-dependent methyltransferase